MSKLDSFYDWENAHNSRKKSSPPKKIIKITNSIDLDPELFRNYVHYWAKKHLSKE